VANKFNSLFRSAINIRNNQNIIKICEKNFKCSRYFRTKEPEQVKKLEGASMKWGVSEAFRHGRNVELVYHDGDLGKEPMVIVFGYNPRDVLQKVKIILQEYVNN
jgi:hydroxymethylpyrimidine/phosphomethylpyrimidine kinase